MLKKWMVLFLTTVFMLAACHSPVYNQTLGNVADAKIKTAAARQKSDDDATEKDRSLLVRQGLYVDTAPINLERDPTWLRSHMVIRGDQLPFSYYSRTIAGGAGSTVLTKYQTGLNPSTNVTLNYTGTVRGALDLLAAKTGYVYSIQGNSIYWQAFVTKTFDIAFMPGGTDYLMGKPSGGSSSTGGGGGGGGGAGASTVSNYVSSDSSDAEFSSLKGSLSIWKDVDTTIKQLLSPEGKVMVSESTTSVTVRDRPTNVELVTQFISNLNRALSKQVLVKIQILEVNLENDYNFGINWDLIVKAFHNSPFVVNGNFGTPITIQSFSTQPTPKGSTTPLLFPQFGTQQAPNTTLPAYTILFNALNQQGHTSIVSEPRVVCLNNQVSVVRIVTQNGYVASIQNTSLAGSSSGGSNTNIGTVTSQITPGTVIAGLTLYILPKILKENIYLQVNADLSTNDGFSTFGQAGTQIQLPNITEKHFNQRSVIRSGDTLILSGFRQVTNKANANQFLTSQALGGKGSQELNTETIILITPIILHGTA
jgi:type IVB pilus formation R64 PilN family outer membrane protein